jgi:TrmH family RNA methyltransferase
MREALLSPANRILRSIKLMLARLLRTSWRLREATSLLPKIQRDRLDVVLVSPRNPLNIGAAARAMANFGFTRLAVVAAYTPHWREARSAVGAPEQLKVAREVMTLAEAIADSTLVLGTGTLTHRKPEQQVVVLPELSPLVQQELARGGRVAIVFGPEKHGLTREDLSYCHLLVQIPTDAQQPSMNLGQAVAVCLYELARTVPNERIADHAAAQREVATGSKASSGTLDLLADLIDQTIMAAGYSPRSLRAANRHDLHLLLRRLSLSPADAKRALGVFRRILWRLMHPGS